MREKIQEKLTLTVPEAARVLGISRGLAYQMAREGMIPTLRFGRRLVVPRKAIDRMLEEPSKVNLHRSNREEYNAKGGRSSRGDWLGKNAGGRKDPHLEN